jgi:hypothetical protein
MAWSSLLLSGLFAGLVAIGVTVAIERWGGRLGGVLGTLPTTIVPASIGIFHESVDVESFRAAMYTTPAGILINVIFLLIWRELPPKLPEWSMGRRLTSVLVTSMAAWAVMAVFVVTGMDFLRNHLDSLLWVGLGLTLAIGAVGGAACLRAPAAPKGRRRVGPVALASRGILAAVAIGGAVWLASVGGALGAGVAAVFPAIFLTTMVSLWVSQGESVQAGAVGPMMLGATSVASFAMLSSWALPALGSWLGGASAWVAAAALVTAPAALWLRRRDSAKPSARAEAELS